MVEPLRHRQTKGAETDMLSLTSPRHVSTLRIAGLQGSPREGPEFEPKPSFNSKREVAFTAFLRRSPFAGRLSALDRGRSLIGVLQSSILGVDVLAGVTVLFGVGSMSPHHGCQG